ncbi:gap junction beta-5 protein [Notolabrus celidotus]|uniref:gap junction beta-5 protein n=1 Tax=Notolabrus celidotus TaxID=1203425 RepID=UPI00148FC371|nr:gap junction beta-5 protein [Notolabrus celidotus]
MAALVTGLIPILRTAADATTTYKCRSLWFGFLSIRLVILFLAELPFNKLDADFNCNGTDAVCTRACFNSHFNKPMVVAWNFIYVLVIISVLLMELFTLHLRSMADKQKRKARDEEMEAKGKEDTDPKESMVLDFHRAKGTVGFYLLSIVLRILVETWFVYILLSWNLPALHNDVFECPADICSGFHVCVVRAAPEKRMSIYALASISAMVIVVSVLFCMYSIAHYLCNF